MLPKYALLLVILKEACLSLSCITTSNIERGLSVSLLHEVVLLMTSTTISNTA
jgi:hypothetical protein